MTTAAPSPRVPDPAHDPARKGDRSFRWWIVGIALAAVALRAGYLSEIREMGFWSVPLGDAAVYAARAAGIAAGDWRGPADFVHAPLYAYVMALPRLAGLTELAWVRWMQIAMSAASLALLMALTRRMFSRRAAIFAGMLYALLPSAIYFDGLIEKSSLAVLLTLAMLAAAMPAAPAEGARPRAAWFWARWPLAGALLGLLVLTRQNALALLPLAAAMGALAAGRDRPRAARALAAAALTLAGFAAAVAPWAIRNKIVLGDAVLSTPNMGQNFWMGNDPRSTGTYLSFARGKVNPEHEQAEWVKEAEAATGRTMSAKEVSDWYFARGLTFIREQPWAWLKLTGKKILMTIGAYELPDTEDYYLYAEHSALLRTLDAVGHFGILVPFAAAGIVLTARDWRRLWPLHAYLALTILSVAAFVVFARYRFPLAPVLVMFAAATIDRLLPRREAAGAALEPPRGKPGSPVPPGGRARRAVAAGVFVAMILACHARVHAARAVNAVAFSNHADALVNAGRVDEALLEYRKALVLDDRDAETHAAMGSALARRNRFDEALFHFERARALAPAFARAHAGMGRALMMLGRPSEAEAALREALRLEPDDLESLELLGWALGASGRAAEAGPVLERALATGRAGVLAHVHLANVRAMTGRFEEADALYRRALEREPENPDALTGLAIAAARQGKWPEAREWARRALAASPNNPVARRILDEAPAEP